MVKRLCDACWQCLPKEAREFIERQFIVMSECEDYGAGYDQALIDIFGEHNLTSDTEPDEELLQTSVTADDELAKFDQAWQALPESTRDFIRHDAARAWLPAYARLFGWLNITSESVPCEKRHPEEAEMLMVPREKIVKKCSEAAEAYAKDGDPYDNGYVSALYELFGDKCLPDELEHGLEQTSVKVEGESVKVEPKFKVGDKVRIILCTHPEYRNKVGIITSIDSCGNPYVKVDGLGTLFHAPYALEPYTEPETKDMEEKN